MVLVKILGAVDMVAAFAFMLMIFGFDPFLSLVLFSSGLLFFKGLFVLTGDVLSFIDLFSSFTLILGLFFSMPMFLLWTFAFLLLGKGLVSFI